VKGKPGNPLLDTLISGLLNLVLEAIHRDPPIKAGGNTGNNMSIEVLELAARVGKELTEWSEHWLPIMRQKSSTHRRAKAA
jgi:hypothetical protein